MRRRVDDRPGTVWYQAMSGSRIKAVSVVAHTDASVYVKVPCLGGEETRRRARRGYFPTYLEAIEELQIQARISKGSGEMMVARARRVLEELERLAEANEPPKLADP